MECEMRRIFIRQCQFCFRDERVVKYFLMPEVLGSAHVLLAGTLLGMLQPSWTRTMLGLSVPAEL